MAKAAFISYASEDASVASTISAYLERSGVSCWIASRDVRPGADYAAEIIDGIETSAVLVLVLTEHANSSEFVKREVERAVSKGKPVFPVRVRDVAPSKSLELFISSAEWIDAWHPPIEQYLGRLADSIRSAAALYASRADRPAVVLPGSERSGDRVAGVQRAEGGGIFQKPITIALAVAVLVLAVSLARSMMRGTGEASNPVATRSTGAGSPSPSGSSSPTTSGSSTPSAGTTPAPSGSAAASTGGLSPTDPCPRYLGINRELPTPFTCSCSAQATTGSSVWGTDFYTDDSGLCRAAVHAGVITPAGGSITVNRTGGHPLYVGSTRNGVESLDFPAFPVSIEFKGTAPPPPGPGLCPRYFGISRELPTPFTCRCSVVAIQSGTVWGTDTYTDDSSLCRAALHAGKVAPAGGTVTVLRAEGRQLYVGTTRNGVQSTDFGAFPVSITFR